MRPLPSSRGPASTRRSDSMCEGGGDGHDVSVGGSVASSGRRVERVGVNPTWMKKMEDRYQQLHRKIAAIPTSNSPASRFNFLTRRFLSETLAKATKKQTNNNNNVNRTSTAPSTTTYRNSLQTEELFTPVPDVITDSDDDSDEENLPPQGTEATRPAIVDNDKAEDLGSHYHPNTLQNLSQPNPAVTLLFPHRRIRGSAGSLETLCLNRSPLLECDGSVEGNANMAGELAATSPLAQYITRTARGTQPQDSTTSQPMLYSGVSAGQPAGYVSGTADHDSLGDNRDGAANDWLDRHMAELSASGLRTLNPISTAGSKRGTMVRAAHTRSQYSYTTTKSCPAILTGNNPPSAARRRSGGRCQLESRDSSGQGGMRVFAQMSVEARHAITETLKEMGDRGEKEKSKEKEQFREKEHSREKEAKDEAPVAKKDNTNTTFPALQEPALPVSAQYRRSKPPHRSSSTHGSRDHSMTASYKTLPRQRSHGMLRQADTTSSVNATVRGGRSPRKNAKKPGSVTTSTNVRLSCKSARTVETCAAVCSEDDMDRQADLFDQFSMASAKDVSPDRSSTELGPPQRTTFPAITSRTEPEMSPLQSSSQHYNYRIRGVGSYRVPREHTFEITAPDFDIRYRDVITCQKGDRDTPPPDVYEKSVGKVRDWLNKYFFQS